MNNKELKALRKCINSNGGWFDYSCFDIIIDNKNPISRQKRIFICPIHGPFLQQVRLNYSKSDGCPGCKKIMVSLKKSDNGDLRNAVDWYFKSKIKHGRKFDYTNVEYKDKSTKVYLTCNKHGSILTTPSQHDRSKTGCFKCGSELGNWMQKQKSNLRKKKKKCNCCESVKNINEFPRYKQYRNGKERQRVAGTCKSCKRKKQRKYDDPRFYIKKKVQNAIDKRNSFLEQGHKTDIVFIDCEDCSTIQVKKRSAFNNRQKVCKCDKCYYAYKARQRWKDTKEERYEKYKAKCIEDGPNVCKCCGKKYYQFEDEASSVTCSDKCRKKHTKHAKKARDRKRIKRHSKIKESYTPFMVFNRDKWKCQNCGCRVQKKDIYADNAAEVDHVITCANGGVDEYWNVQTLCRKCNSNKGANNMGQLQIFHNVA